MAGAKDFNEAIAQLKEKYPHRREDIDFLVAHVPESENSFAWQKRLLSIERVIRRDEIKKM